METFIKKGEYKRLYNNTYLMVDVMDYRGCVIAKFYDTKLADEYIAFKMGKNKPVEIPEITETKLTEGQKLRICELLEESLNGVRLQNYKTEDDDNLPLVDLLSPGDTILEGQEEITNIVEQIFFDMDTWDIQLKPVEIPEITDEGNLLFNEMGEFSVKTFTGATAKGHLRKLKEEADEAIEDPTDIKEYADCLMALFGAAYKAGFTYDALIQAGKEKLEINKSRKWVKLENEIYQHVIENGTEKNNVKE